MMQSLPDLVARFRKEYGEEVGGFGVPLHNPPRLQTGWFPFDLALGGGIPEGKMIEIFGPEGSGKTNIALKLIAQKQKRDPDKKCVFIDIEGSLDAEWASMMGVDVSSLLYLQPSYAEQVVDISEALLSSPECGIIVLDSLAAMVTIRESEQSAEKTDVGGSAIQIQKLCRKVGLAQNLARQRGFNPSFLMINQIRNKIGVLHGNPETTPGGNAPKYFSVLRIRLYGKDIMDSKISTDVPVVKKTTFIIRKKKIAVVGVKGEYDLVTVPHKNMKVGEVNDWNTFAEYMKKHGYLKKGEKKGWLLEGDSFDTLVAVKEYLDKNADYARALRKAIIDAEIAAVMSGG